MENIEIILSLGGTIISFVITAIIAIARLIKWKKNYKSLEEENELYDSIGQLMAVAESYYNYLGKEKKEYVLTKLNQFAIDNGIEFDAKKATERIEELIKLTKSVNYRDSKKSEFKVTLGKKDI